MLAAFAAGVGRGAAPARAAQQGARDRRRDRRGAARASGRPTASSSPARRGAWPTRSRTSTSSPPPPTRRRCWPRFAELDVIESAVVARRERRAGAHPHGHRRRPARRRARPVRQPAAALHRLQGAQHGAARGGRAPRAARLRVRRPRRRDGRDAPLRDRGGGLRAARPAVDPARAARGPRRAGAAADGDAAGPHRAGRPQAATCTCTRRLATGAPTPRRWRSRARELGLEYIAITDHSATHGFGNHVTPDALRAQIEAIRALDERLDGIRVLIGTETNIGTDGTPDYDDDLLAAARLGRRLGPHVVRDRRATR